MADRKRIEEIWARHLAGEAASPDEVRAVTAALAEDPALRASVLGDRHLDGLLRSLAATRAAPDVEAFVKEVLDRITAERDGDRFAAAVERKIAARPGRVAAPERGRWRLWPWALALPAAAALAAVFVAARRDEPAGPPGFTAIERAPAPAAGGAPGAPRPTGGAGPVEPAPSPAATVAAIHGVVFVLDGGTERRAAVGDALAAAQGVRTAGPASRVRLVLADGSALELLGDATLARVGAGGAPDPAGRAVAFVARGTVRVTAAPRPAGGTLVLATRHAEIGAAGGARLALTAADDGTRVAVEDGRARLGGAGAAEAIALEGGQESWMREGIARVAAAGRPARRRALFLVGRSGPLGAGDAAVQGRLESLGLDIAVREARDVALADTRGAALLAMSATIESVEVTTWFRDLPIPIVIWESSLFDELGMTGWVGPSGRGDEGGHLKNQPSEISIKNPAHPLAAGLAGTVRVTTTGSDRDLRFGSPSPFAEWIATYPGMPTRAAIFGYERGAPMVEGTAPARRVALFLGNDTATVLNEAGWALFDAAVRWALAPAPEPAR